MNVRQARRKVKNVKKRELTPEEKIKLLESIKAELNKQENNGKKSNNLINSISEFGKHLACDRDINIQLGCTSVVCIAAAISAICIAEDTTFSLMAKISGSISIGAFGMILANIGINGGNCDKKEILNLIDEMIKENQAVIEKSNI